jgi:hypothetical protein
LSDGLVLASQGPADVGLAVRVARDMPLDGSALPPFIGARLPEWTRRCVSSPFGVFTSTVPGRPSTPMHSADGEVLSVFAIGSIDWHDGLGEQELFDWMSTQARERDIEVREAGRLERIVFEEGAVSGAVFTTPDGPYSVRTRYGLTMSPTERLAVRPDTLAITAATERMQVCLVAHTGSRFARVELLAATSDEVVRRPVCTGSGRELPDDLRRSRSKTSEASRCGKVDGYPPRRRK